MLFILSRRKFLSHSTFFFIKNNFLIIIINVCVLHFSEGTAPCSFFKSQKCTLLPFLKIKIAPCHFLEIKNASCPISELKKKGRALFPPLVGREKWTPTENHKMLLEKYASEKIPALKNNRFCTKTLL